MLIWLHTSYFTFSCYDGNVNVNFLKFSAAIVGIYLISYLNNFITAALYLISLISSIFYKQIANKGNLLSYVLIKLQKDAITWFLVSDEPVFNISSNDLIVLLTNFGNLIVVFDNNLTATATNYG